MARSFTILVGTMTGTADLVASEIAATLGAKGAEVQRHDMNDAGPEVFQPGRDYIICTSTYGSGDVPDNAQLLFDALTLERPDLSAIRYTVFALGDSTYQQTFAFGGKRFDHLLTELGAQRFAGMFIHNASGGTLPEDDCVPWAAALLEAPAHSAAEEQAA